MMEKTSLLHGLQDPDLRTADLCTAMTGLAFIRQELAQVSRDVPMPEGMLAALECLIKQAEFEANMTMELLESLTLRVRESEAVDCPEG